MAGGTLSPNGRENSPYRHLANRNLINTPELGGVFCLPASRRPVCAFCKPTGERNLLKVSWRRPGIASPPESPGPLRNHLCIVVALVEEGQTDLSQSRVGVMTMTSEPAR